VKGAGHVRAATGSSRIEGLEASQRRIARALATDEDRDETARSVIANVAAMTLAVEIATATRELTVDDILAVHDRLMVLPRERRRPTARATRPTFCR
jgi:Fic family protein